MRPDSLITTRLCKAALVAAMAFYFALVVFNNITDFDSNYQFVRHVLSMDSTFPGNRGMWRAIREPWVYTAFYVGIIAWEAACAALCGWAAVAMLRGASNNAEFARARGLAATALTVGMLQWFVAFLCVGAEWFLMWQSRTWNGQEAAFRMFAIEGILLLMVLMPEPRSTL